MWLCQICYCILLLHVKLLSLSLALRRWRSAQRDSVPSTPTNPNMSDALSSHATDAINRSIELSSIVTPEDLGASLDEVYEVLETAAELNKHNFRRVSRIAIL